LNFGDLNYSQDELATIDASLRMDRCIQVYWYYLFTINIKSHILYMGFFY
jgi:hypothetical protein